MTSFPETLTAAANGDRHAPAALFQMLYDDLKRLAVHRLASEHPGHTLQPTALVHEAYLRLVGTPEGDGPFKGAWAGKSHFFAAASEAMRRILIESARRKMRVKRGGDRRRERIDPDQLAEPELADDLIALDSALTKLEAVEPGVAGLVKLRYFGGLTLKEAAATIGIAPRTADAHWAYARAWLLAEMRGPETSDGTV